MYAYEFGHVCVYVTELGYISVSFVFIFLFFSYFYCYSVTFDSSSFILFCSFSYSLSLFFFTYLFVSPFHFITLYDNVTNCHTMYTIYDSIVMFLMAGRPPPFVSRPSLNVMAEICTWIGVLPFLLSSECRRLRLEI